MTAAEQNLVTQIREQVHGLNSLLAQAADNGMLVEVHPHERGMCIGDKVPAIQLITKVWKRYD